MQRLRRYFLFSDITLYWNIWLEVEREFAEDSIRELTTVLKAPLFVAAGELFDRIVDSPGGHFTEKDAANILGQVAWFSSPKKLVWKFAGVICDDLCLPTAVDERSRLSARKIDCAQVEICIFRFQNPVHREILIFSGTLCYKYQWSFLQGSKARELLDVDARTGLGCQGTVFPLWMWMSAFHGGLHSPVPAPAEILGYPRQS